MKPSRGLGLVLAATALAACESSTTTSDEPQTCVALAQEFKVDTTVPKGCYIAAKTPSIGDGATLTLAAGVTIRFESGAGLFVSGNRALIAQGTAAAPILLTGTAKTRGAWNGVRFDGTGSKSSSLSYVTVEYAGATKADTNAAGIKATADSSGVGLNLQHVTVRQSQGYGLYLVGSAKIAQFDHNTFTANALGPVMADVNAVGYLDSTSTYKGNDLDRVMVHTGHLNQHASWAGLDVPYLMDGPTNVDTPWTVAAGATLILSKDAWISVNGDDAALNAVGTEAKPIRFTGATAERGAWDYLVFNGSNHANNRLEWVTIEYGGSTAHDKFGACLRATGDSHGVTVPMVHVAVQKCQGFGATLTGSAALPSFANNSFTGNGLGPMRIGSTAVWQLDTTSTYSGNDKDEVSVDADWIDKTSSWHDLGVPYHLDNNLQVNGKAGKPVVWTIDPGVTLILDAGVWFGIAGDDSGLHAVGTAAKPITFTGATKQAGFWSALRFDTTNNAANVLEYATIEYGGSGVKSNMDKGLVTAHADSHGVTVSVKNCTLRHGAGYGLWLGGSAKTNTDIDTANTFADNALGNVFHE
ncbi:MAG: hypothetical protein HY902_03320 [Deltaproteobacteria bacterium]|nr:hypothetical protein [Deltaproteobacteria bacterium]